jgi:signal transduction histidine kinase
VTADIQRTATRGQVFASSIRHRGLIAASIGAAAAGLLAALFGFHWSLVSVANTFAVIAGIAAWATIPRSTDESSLVAEVSHELRTPLTGILGTLELLTDSTVPLEPSEVDELLISAHGDANHLLHVVGNLHARSRLDRALLQPESVPTNLRTIVERAVSRAPQVAQRCYLSPGDTAVAVGDPQLIMQIVTNLVQNIERYAPDGEVRVMFERRDDAMTASFIDTGPGIASNRRSEIFEDGASSQGLGLGLNLSRQLARAMGGDLTVDTTADPGASFTLHLPASAESIPVVSSAEILPGDRVTAYSPRARLLVDLVEALSKPSLNHVVGGIQKIYAELLGATGAMLVVSRKDGSFYQAGPHAQGDDISKGSSRELDRVVAEGEPIRVDDVDVLAWVPAGALGGDSAMLLPVHDDELVVAVLAVGWKRLDVMPRGPAVHVAEGLANLTAPAIARTALTRDVVFERRLRASVMDELPIAVSVFAGNPPRVVDWNRKERELLGIDHDSLRPSDLAASQHKYDVRFADGTALTVDNAPVTTAIRTGKATGPFILLVRRADGSQIHTRTYCAPFLNDEGHVAGAVVTSEPLDIAIGP